MRTNKINNNQPAFGMIYPKIKNNGRADFLAEFNKLAEKLDTEKGKELLIEHIKYIHMQESSIVESITLTLQCKKKNSPNSVNYQGETDLLNRIQKWAHRKGFGKIEFKRDNRILKGRTTTF